MSQDLSTKSQNDNLCTYEYDKKRDSWDTIHMVQGTALVFMCPSLHKCIHDVEAPRKYEKVENGVCSCCALLPKVVSRFKQTNYE